MLNTYNIVNDGFQKTNKIKKIHKLTVNCEVTHIDSLNEDFIKEKLAKKLGSHIVNEGLVSFHKINTYNDYNNFVISAEINVAEPGLQYVNMEENLFIVDNEEFTNEDLVNAVKSYYAERFI